MLDHPYRILIADDEEASRDLIARLLREEFGSLDLLIEIAAVATVAEAKKSLRAFSEADRPFDVLILDWKFAGHKGNGDDLLRWLKAESLHVNTEVILLTGHLDENPRLPEIVLEHGAYAFAEKATVLGIDHAPRAGDAGTLTPKGFVFLIKNCIERVRVRREQRKVLDLVGEMHKKLTNTLVLDEQLDIILQYPKQICAEIHKASIRMSTPGTDQGVELECLARVDCAQCLAESRNRKTGGVIWAHQGIVGHVFKTGKEYLRNKNIKEDPLYVEACPHTKSEFCLPLKVSGRVNGVLNLESPFEGSFDHNKIEAIRAVAEVASPSLRNATVFKTLLRMTDQIVQRVAEEGGDAHAAERVAAFDSIRLEHVAPLFGLVLDYALRLTNAKFGVVFMADRMHRALHLAAERGMETRWKTAHSELSYAGENPQGICPLVARDGKTRRTTGDPEQDKDLWNHYAPFKERQEEIKSFLTVPIKLGENVFGVIDLEDEAPDKFSYLDQVVVGSFANMAASALGNAALLVSLKERRKLEVRLMLDELLKMFAHDFKSPLNSFLYSLAHCRQLLDKPDLGGLREHFNIFKERLQHALKSIDDALKQAKEEADSVEFAANIDLQAMLEDVSEAIKKEFPGYKVVTDSVAFDGNAKARANPLSVKLVMKELIKNAAQSVKGEGLIMIGCRHEGKDVYISFHDDGPGVPINDFEKIFALGYTTKNSTGQGLYRARRFIKIQLGDLTLDKDNRRGARFILQLPSAPMPVSSHGQ